MYISVSGIDYTIILHLFHYIIYSSTDIISHIIMCLRYVWNGVVYTILVFHSISLNYNCLYFTVIHQVH